MRGKILGACLIAMLLVAAQGILSTGASAQTPPVCYDYVFCGAYSITNTLCIPQLPVNAYNCIAIPYAFTSVCRIPSKEPSCAPPPPCNCGHAGHPINLSTGNTYIDEADVKLQGLGSLTLDRRWNSIWPSDASGYQIGMFGPNWRSTFEEAIFVGSDHYVKYLRADGTVYSLTYDPETGLYPFVAPANFSASLSSGTSYWTLAFQNGEKRLFDNTTGKLTAIIDRNGNTTALAYDSLNRLSTVTDPVSRHLYFGYGTGSGLVASVTSDFGTSLSYTYDTSGRLTQVSEPDASTISFNYNSASLITSVLDSDGHTLETHTYDSAGRGLTSSQAGGVNAVTISY